MEVKISRHQYKSLVLRRRRYRIDIRGTYTKEQLDLIQKYKLKNQHLYTSDKFKQAGLAFEASKSMWSKLWSFIKLEWSLKIRVKHMVNGRRIRCKDIGLLLEAERQVLDAAKTLLGYIAACETFDGREMVHQVEDANEQ